MLYFVEYSKEIAIGNLIFCFNILEEQVDIVDAALNFTLS